jgi:hypothetical protein
VIDEELDFIWSMSAAPVRNGARKRVAAVALFSDIKGARKARPTDSLFRLAAALGGAWLRIVAPFVVRCILLVA